MALSSSFISQPFMYKEKTEIKRNWLN